ncbi:Methyltransferase [Giardia muris]|uniref:Methyltransferase n=1 Tax=Giardia muris TaxID=5742 RepID=A0A4Z1SZ50_GIAMU|nr:Methyltransferase [Giardia muris]|eukprot:TNJ30045.1 Methyltransferase [Giardia muris]
MLEETSIASLLMYIRGSQRFTRRTLTFEPHPPEEGGSKDTIFVRELPVIAGWVGCGVWDAAIIMSRYLITHPEVLQGKRVLELGSGVGLTGLIASRFSDEVVLTDYSESILENLEYNIWLNAADLTNEHLDDIFPEDRDAQARFRTQGQAISRAAKVAYLDWFHPMLSEKPVESFESDTNRKLPLNGFRRRVPGGVALGRFPMIIGSELTYQLSGVEELAEVIDIFLEEGGVFFEILSIYRGPGPRRFMELMEENGWVVEAREPDLGLCDNIDSVQSRNRNERYLFWTLFRKRDLQRLGDIFPRFGIAPPLDWKSFHFTGERNEIV